MFSRSYVGLIPALTNKDRETANIKPHRRWHQRRTTCPVNSSSEEQLRRNISTKQTCVVHTHRKTKRQPPLHATAVISKNRNRNLSGRKPSRTAYDKVRVLFTTVSSETFLPQRPRAKQALGALSPRPPANYTPSHRKPTTRQRPILLKGHERAITCVVYNNDGDLVFTAAKDQIPSLWYAKTGERIGTYQGHQGAVWDLSVSCE